MRRFYYLIIALLLSASSIKAQTSEGTDFWLTFGHIGGYPPIGDSHLQIRVVAKDHKTTGTIFFTQLGTSIGFEIEARQVYTYELSEIERFAVYNGYQTPPTGDDLSIHITTNMPVTVYAMNQYTSAGDATNVLPVTALGTEYYQISYRARTSSGSTDAYAVIATKDNTEVYQNNIQVATLNRGYVYYACDVPNSDMTGYHISANKPIAHFALNSRSIPHPPPLSTASSLFQQMAPIRTWGEEFFVPISHTVREYVRIVASQNNTKITQTGGTVRTDVQGAQTNLNNLQAGEFVELEVPLSNLGCYIEADKPVGVCTFLPGLIGPPGNPAQCWIPPIEQSVMSALIAPFIVTGYVSIDSHYATLFTKTVAKDDIKVAIGGGPPTDLSGGVWIDNAAAGMSFYKMPLSLTNDTAAYYFTSSSEGFLIFGYGTQLTNGSYYYPAYSAMRNLSAVFSANGVDYSVGCGEEMGEHLFCENDITFTTNIVGVEEMKELNWYVKKALEPETAYVLIHQDEQTWTDYFKAGNYTIKMEVIYNDDTELSCEGELCIGVWVKPIPVSPAGGTVSPAAECYKVGSHIELRVLPH